LSGNRVAGGEPAVVPLFLGQQQRRSENDKRKAETIQQ
jgi:hypothetical protein